MLWDKVSKSQYMKQWRIKNKEKIKADKKQWDVDNIEHCREYRRSNAEKINAAGVKWQKENKDKCCKRAAKYRKNNRSKILLTAVLWRRANPESTRIRNSAYRGTKLHATPLWIDLDLVKDMYQEAVYQQMEVDHIVPLVSTMVCGLHWEGNLQLLTKKDNRAKGNRYWPGM